MQELLGQVTDPAGCQSSGQGMHPGGKHTHEQPASGVEPSPLMRWTSDGSMMEELLKTFTYAPLTIPAECCKPAQHRVLGRCKLSSCVWSKLKECVVPLKRWMALIARMGLLRSPSCGYCAGQARRQQLQCL